jgi:hypothetical protein
VIEVLRSDGRVELHTDVHTCLRCDGAQVMLMPPWSSRSEKQEYRELVRGQGMARLVAVFVCEACSVVSFCCVNPAGEGVTVHVQMPPFEG